jgi:aldose 1-epimerase
LFAIGSAAYDFCFCLSDARRPLTEIGRLESGGLTLVLESTESGLQIYDGDRPGALAIEAQNWSGAPNQPGFPSDVVRPGEVLEQITRWTFGR